MFFNTDVPDNAISCLVKQERCQQAAHTSVTVMERMDAEKIKYKIRDK